ncbi:MAG: cation transport regulator [Paraglaciecola sp.]|jgi:cation transport regulator
MPYQSLSDLPEGVQRVLPKHAEQIYLAAFNHAYEQYKDPQDRHEGQSLEEVAHKVAWSAVKHRYHKDENERWITNP